MRAFAILVFLTAGCGLADYERRMDTQRARLKYFDEENQLLGEPAEMPKTKDGADLFEIFLRLPSDFRLTPAKDPHIFEGVALFRYRGGEAGTLLLGAASVAEKTTTADDGPVGETPDEFQRKTMGALKEYHRKFYGDVTMPTQGDRETFEPMGLKGPLPKFEVDRFVLTDKERSKSEFTIYFHRRAGNQVAVIYQVPVDKARDMRRAIEFSLKTLTIDPEKLSDRRAEYELRGRFRK